MTAAQRLYAAANSFGGDGGDIVDSKIIRIPKSKLQQLSSSLLYVTVSYSHSGKYIIYYY